MGKTRDLFKKIRDTKGIFHVKMGTIKDRNGMDLTEDIKKRWQEYTEELQKKEGSQEIPGVIGKFGLGVQNEAGQRLTELCQENTLVIANTLFQQHKR